MIMKKNYFKPEVESVNIALGNIIATSGNTTVDPDESAGSGDPDEIGAGRGEWGNFWKK